MQNITQIQISTGYLDVNQFELPLNFGIADVRNISERNGSWSKTIKLPGTKNNNILLNNYFDVNVDAGTFDVNKKTECSIIKNGTVLIDNCYLILLKVNKNLKTGEAQDNLVSYEVQVLNTMADLFKNISTLELRDLKFDEFNHNYTTTNIIDSFDNTVINGYKYVMPHITGNEYFQHEFLPGIYAKQYFDKIHANAGFSYSWPTLSNSNVKFDKLIIPYSGDKKKLSKEFINEVEVIANNLTLQTLPHTPAAGVIISSPSIKLDVDNEIKDLTNIYNPVTSIYTSPFAVYQPNSLQYEIEIDWEMEFNNNNTQPVLIRKINTGSDSTLSIFPRLDVVNQSNINKGYIDVPFLYKNPFFTNLEITDGKIVLSTAQVVPVGNINIGGGTSILTISATQINVGDLLELRRRIGFFWTGQGYLTTSQLLPPPAPAPIPLVLGTTLKINSIKVRIVPAADSHILPGSQIFMNKLVPEKVKQSDFLKSIYQLYNLYATLNPDNPNNIIYQHRDDFYDSGQLKDWTNKLAKDRDADIQFLPEITAKRMILSYKDDDKDFILNAYRGDRGKTYGQVEVIFENENIKGIDRKELLFSPTINLPTDFNANLPVLKSDFNYNIRLLLDNGEFTGSNYIIKNGDGTTTVFFKYPFLSMFDKPINPTFDIAYAQPDYYAYDLGLPTSNNIYTNFWRRTLAQINSGKMQTAYFLLDETDIINLKLNDKIKVGNSLWYINRIIDFNASKRQLTKVELLSIEDDLKLPKSGSLVVMNPGPGVPAQPAPVVPSGPIRPVTEGIIRNDFVRNNTTSLILTQKSFQNFGNNNIIQSGAQGILIGDNIDTDINGIQVGQNTTITESSITADLINVSNEYTLPIVDGNEYEVIHTNGNGQTYWAPASSPINVTRAELLTLRNSNILVPNAFYFITDRNIWLQARGTNIVDPHGVRKQSIIKNTWYTPQVIAGFFDTHYLGIYGQTIAQGSVPVSDMVAGGDVYRAIWGGRMWERDMVGADTPGTSQGEINAGWTVVPFTDTNIYFEKIFKITYNIDTDIVTRQMDDRNNIVYSSTEISGFQSTNLTDWGNELIFNNTSSGIFNNRRTTLPASISLNICQRLINNNRNNGTIINNRCQEIRNNSTGTQNIVNNIVVNEINNNNINGGIDTNIVGGSISNNTNNGRIIVNKCSVSIIGNVSPCTNIDYNNIVSSVGVNSIFDNSNTGNIRENRCNTINNNSNTGNINQNVSTRINNNSNGGSISGNTNNGTINNNDNNGTINFNTNNGVINSNTNNGSISNNSNSGSITLNSNNGFIFSNSNNGNILNNTNVSGIFAIYNNVNNGFINFNQANGTLCDIVQNNNNGNIGASLAPPVVRTTLVSDPQVDK